MEKVRVAVLMGGTSSEREVSLRSGSQAAAALDRETYDVCTVDFTGDVSVITALAGQVDVVLLALHGPGGEDGRMQGLLDLLGLPYTGSGVLGSAMAMHKGVAKTLYQTAGIPTPPGIELPITAAADVAPLAAQALAAVGVPCVVKPASEGSTFGVTIVRAADQLADALTLAARYDREVLVERFVAGVEISVPVLGTDAPRALPTVEIVPQSGFYDYEMKYTPGATQEICPARISETARRLAAGYAIRAHQVLRCTGVSRTDMIVSGDAVTVLETNTLPGMTETSLLPLAAGVAGIPFPALLDGLLREALAARRA